MAQTYLERAFRAYLAANGSAAELPAADLSGEERLNGLKYVVLRNERRVLAVYRKRSDTGALRRMKRWPIALGSAATQPTPEPEPRRPARAEVAHVE